MTEVAQIFPNMAKVRLANRIGDMGMSERVTRWTEDFLSDREVKLKADDDEGEWEKVETGIPQGSPTLPVLFNLYIAQLLREVRERTKK